MLRRRLNATIIVSALAAFVLGSRRRRLFGQGLEYVKAHYTKYEYRIPMRDGVRLFTSVYVPKDQVAAVSDHALRARRTACSPTAPMTTSRTSGHRRSSARTATSSSTRMCAAAGCRKASSSTCGRIDRSKNGPKDIDESTDTYDTIDWLIKHVPDHNGRVGMWGISYPGFYTAAGMIDAHPALKAASPQAPVTDWFTGDDWHHNGAFFLPHAFNFMASFGHPRPEPTKNIDERFDSGTPDGYDFFLRLGPLSNANSRYFKNDVPFWNEIMQHGTYDDFWKARNLRPHLKNIKPAVMTVGGWFDAENLFGALETYKNVEANSPGPRTSW